MFSKEKFKKMMEEQSNDSGTNNKQEMLDTMMEYCCNHMTENEFETKKSKYMKKGQQGAKSGMMGEMMSTMMGGMMRAKMGNQSKKQMCGDMMNNMHQQEKKDESFTTDELMTLFKDWCSHVEE
jgi:hypothetical protein